LAKEDYFLVISFLRCDPPGVKVEVSCFKDYLLSSIIYEKPFSSPFADNLAEPKE
jgi:hypothetical protein